MTDFTLADGTRVHLIGDPHLGKKFEVGVHVSRRGEREQKQAMHFRRELEADADIIVMVGDLFDHPYVGLSVIDAAATAIYSAALNNPDVTFIMMPGNHDLPRNVAAVGAFHDLWDRLHERLPNLVIPRSPEVIRGLAIFPWQWDRTAEEQVADVAGDTAVAAVGHWDLKSFGGSDNHLAPVAALRAAFGDIPLYSGHFHVPGEYLVMGYPVLCTGSLEPYSHGEDPDNAVYVTLDRAEALAQADTLVDKCVRVRLAPGEDLPEINCLALTHTREAVVDHGVSQRVSLDTFDWDAILRTKLATLDPEVREFIEERLPSYEESTAEE